MHEVGTYPNVRTAYLQRLADPEIPYHPTENPYITIDWISIDLTVFNGEEREEPQDPNSFAFQSRYKDGADGLHWTGNAGIDPVPPGRRRATVGSNLLSYSTSSLVRSRGFDLGTSPALGDLVFSVGLGYGSPQQTSSATTLGYLNKGRPLVPNATLPEEFDGFGPTAPSIGPVYDGSSRNPLASYFCMNRPFASPFELMLVSAAGPGELNRVMTQVQLPSLFQQPSSKLFGPFGQMMNFFDTSFLKTSNQANDGTSDFTTYWMKRGYQPATKSDDPPNQADLSLLLEWVDALPGYADSSIVFPPQTVESAPTVIKETMLADFRPPFHMQSRAIVPGKININTIASEEVWKGIEWNFLTGPTRSQPRGDTQWPKLELSRRGYTLGSPLSSSTFLAANQQNPILHAQYPSQFVGAFRSASLANIAPRGSAASSGINGMRLDQGIATTLLRPDLSTSATLPLLLSSQPDYLGLYPLGDRQPFIALQRLVRLSNLVSFQSNVFAVRMTVGFFEYDPVTGLGREYTGFGGEPIRRRGFYIIDRSLPVGYKQGEDINSQSTILLRR